MESVRDIIDNIYELEGLMREIEYRAEDTPDELYDAACRKADMIARAVSALHEAGEPVAAEPEPFEVPVPKPIAVPEPVIVPEPDIALEPEIAPEPEPEEEYSPEVTEVAIPVAPTVGHESIFDAPALPNEAASETEPEHSAAKRECSGSQDVPTVNLRSMFTINDLFRFRRELFGNSEADMTDVLNMVMAMHSYEEAEEYFYGYLCWPQDNEQVADFMNVVNHYFGNVR